MKERNKLSGKQCNLLSYFKYLKSSCLILLDFIETIEDSLDDMECWAFSKFTFKYQVHFVYKKNLPNKETMQAYNELGKEVDNLLKNP